MSTDTRMMGESKRRDQNADPLPGDDLFPTVNCAWLITRIVVAVIAPWLVLGAIGAAVVWALS